MKNAVFAIAVSLSLTIAAISWAQTDGDSDVVEDKIPKAALLTERGQQLADRLKQLRRTESNMGSKHPSLEDVRTQIEEVKVQLEAWLPGPNPFQASNDLPIQAIPTMNDEDLRQLVLRLTDDIRQLRMRVERLERKF